MSESYNHQILQLDDLVSRLECGVDNLDAVQQSMVEGDTDIAVSNSVLFVSDGLYDIAKSLRASVDSMLKTLKEEGTGERNPT